MSELEKPVYIVALRDEWWSLKGCPDGALVCWGTEDDARKFAASVAEDNGIPLALFRIVEYSFSGKVIEG